jgi:hypothetical protein
LISASELSALGASADQAEEMIVRADRDGDGVISLDEYLAVRNTPLFEQFILG